MIEPMEYKELGELPAPGYDPALARTLVRPAPSRSCGDGSGRRVLPLLAAVAMGLMFASLTGGGHHRTNHWRIPGPPPAPRASLDATPDFFGTWVGRFDGDPALLTVTSQYEDRFRAIMTVSTDYGTYHIRVHGSATPDLQIDETRVLDTPLGAGWALGIDAGTLSPDGLSASGTGLDSAGRSYHWSFSHQSIAPVIPAE